MSLVVVSLGAGLYSLTGTSVVDNGDGTFTVTDAAVVDNGDGTFTVFDDSGFPILVAGGASALVFVNSA